MRERVTKRGLPKLPRLHLKTPSGQAQPVRPPYDNVLVNVSPDEVYQAVAQDILVQSLKRLPEELAKRIAGRRDVSEPVAGDTFYVMYSYHPMLKKKDQIKNDILREFVDLLEEWMSTKEFANLRSITRLNKTASTVFALRFVMEFFKELTDWISTEEWPPNPHPGEGPQGDGGQGQGQGGWRKPNPEEIEEAVELAFVSAKERAKEAIETYRTLGSLIKGTTPAKLAFLDEEPGINFVEFFTIIYILGKIKKAIPIMFSQHKVRAKLGMPGGYGITRKPEKAIPRELALPEELFLAKLVKGQLLTREKFTREKGIMILLLDRSDSMSGWKISWAKAVALALGVKAMKEKLDYVLIPFDYDTHEPMELDQLEDIMRISTGGGTNIGHAIVTGLELAIKNGYKRANIIVITDGDDTEVVDYEPKILELARKAKANIKVFYIKGTNETLKRIARATKGQLLTVEPSEESAVSVVSIA